VIYDTVTSRRYVDVVFPSELVAWVELRSLLSPYPVGHVWRRRLEVREAALVSAPVRVGLPRLREVVRK